MHCHAPTAGHLIPRAADLVLADRRSSQVIFGATSSKLPETREHASRNAFAPLSLVSAGSEERECRRAGTAYVAPTGYRTTNAWSM